MAISSHPRGRATSEPYPHFVPTQLMSELKAPGSMCSGTHYILNGPEDGELVVFMHGTGYYLSHFNRMAAHLNSLGFRTLQYDFIGRGFSEPSKTGLYGVEDHLAQLHSLVETLQLPRPFHLVGHSFGGAIATCFTASHPSFIKSLTLLAPAGLINSFPMSMIRNAPLMRRALKNTQKQLPNRIQAWRQDFFNHTGAALELEEEIVKDLTQLYTARPQVFDAYFSALMQGPMYGIGPYLDQIAANPNISVMLMWGKEDKAMAFKPHFDRFCQHFNTKACKFATKMFVDTAHGFLLEKHKEVNEAVSGFLRQC